MKTLFAATAALALVAGAGMASAQMYGQPQVYGQPMPQTLAPPMQANPMQANPMQAGPMQADPGQPPGQQPSFSERQSTAAPQPSYVSGTPSWMQDDGSSSVHPIHNPGDFSADRLNSEYRNGIPVPPGEGFPALPEQR